MCSRARCLYHISNQNHMKVFKALTARYSSSFCGDLAVEIGQVFEGVLGFVLT